jgi:subtilisin family serine protease
MGAPPPRWLPFLALLALGSIGLATAATVVGAIISQTRGRGALFAALGVDVRAAKIDRGFARFTGTSFAAPVVSARLALLLARPDPGAAAAALDALQRDARPLESDKFAARFGYLEPPHAPTISAQQ